jgi:putative endonuclease
MKQGGVVYIMINKNCTVYYVGVTSDLVARVQQHKDKYFPKSFTARYEVTLLAYFETYPGIEAAIAREKQLKKFSRMKKRTLINQMNPEWRDLFEDVKA